MNQGQNNESYPLVGVVMGSRSDWQTMRAAVDILERFSVRYEKKIVSAHRTPELLRTYGLSAAKRGIRVIIAGAGGAAHLPGMIASYTRLPVLGVPIESKVLRGVDSLLSIVQMPFGIPVGCLAIGESGAKNAALLAISILALEDKQLAEKLEAFRAEQTRKVLEESL
ncbi:5-(carboxyamino)imidazole ribonucleotide mutase [Methylacidiphilum sp. Yel]|uniref:5-(carboxyamino)imidazole ribonucleotide mutase n=1 Tax=Methylacidiphilum sp. Yel TaxID=1847730 RepID=UPI00106DB505|nr:5-(carboxyamino)imidazole ribonucleotide mutase [Methylacidiphilum sp. Yel]TFE69659.1 5-(carboxyamino)imidazole ribonucleotide mutase [Methylacidiphilum sp. Yel]